VTDMDNVTEALEAVRGIVLGLIGRSSPGMWLQDCAARLAKVRHEGLPRDVALLTIRAKLCMGVTVPNLPAIGPLMRPDDLPPRRVVTVAEGLVALLEALALAGGSNPDILPLTALGHQPLPRSLAYAALGWPGHEENFVYARFLQTVFPHYPSEVVRGWLQRHCANVFETYGESLRFEELVFEQEDWSYERAISLTRGLPAHQSFARVERDADELRRSRLFLARRQESSGTWPTPPVVLADSAEASAMPGAIAGMPYILDGRTRIRILADARDPLARDKLHRIWVASYRTIDSSH